MCLFAVSVGEHAFLSSNLGVFFRDTQSNRGSFTRQRNDGDEGLNSFRRQRVDLLSSRTETERVPLSSKPEVPVTTANPARTPASATPNSLGR